MDCTKFFDSDLYQRGWWNGKTYGHPRRISKFCRRPFISSVFPQEFVEIEKKDQLYYLRTALPFLKSASDGPKERLFEICRSKGLIKSVTVAELANDVEVTISISTAG